MSALDAARAELQRHGRGPAFVAALEAFEAAVRANERGPREPMTTDRAAAILAPLEAKARELEARDRAVHRAAVLREAADVVGNDDTCDCGGCDSCVPNRLAARLREMADEAQP